MKLVSTATIWILIAAISLIAQSQVGPSNVEGDWKEIVIREVTALERLNAELEAKGKVTEQYDLLSEDYVYIDISGKRVTKQQLVARRDEDERKSVANAVTQLEVVPLTPELALSRGRWDGRALYYGGLPRDSSSRFMALWHKKNGRWQILADQGTPIGQHQVIERHVKSLSPEEIKSYTGSFLLRTDSPLKITLTSTEENLLLTIPGHLEKGITFYPSNDGIFFAKERPWEIHFQNSESITFVSWGIKTEGARLK